MRYFHAVLCFAVGFSSMVAAQSTQVVNVDDSDLAISYRADTIAFPTSRWDGINGTRDVTNGVCKTASGYCFSAELVPALTWNGGCIAPIRA